ncbi:MAG TPA: hypothetical protein EYQ69_02480 [Gemmatimonadetes bacterium]|nr:hypothetical protein [Gemmatimonadota bacterium]
MMISVKYNLPTLLTVGLICLTVEMSAQTSNSLNSNLSRREGVPFLEKSASGQADEEVIPFRLEEQLFENGNKVMVSLRVFNILQHFVAVPKISGYSNGSDPPGSSVVNLSFDEPGMHYAAWDKSDSSGKKVVPGVYFVQLTIQSEVISDDLSEETGIVIPRRNGIRGFFNKISPGDPFKETVPDALPMDTYNTVMRIVIS